MPRRLFDWYTLHREGDPIHSGCIFFFLGSWDQHHVPALEVSCVLEQAETLYMSVYHQRKAALIVETLRERKKKIRNHQSPITRDQDQEDEADLCLHNRRKRGEIQGLLGMYLLYVWVWVSMCQLWNLFSPSALCILHSASARLSVCPREYVNARLEHGRHGIDPMF